MVLTKGERTRQHIIDTAAPLFNQRGFTGASMADLMEATGLEKGGIYRHFGSKDEVAVAAFDHAVELQTLRIREYALRETTAVGRLSAFCNALASSFRDPVVTGGCPLLNTAIECDDGNTSVHAELRVRSRRAMRRLIAYARKIIATGVESGELVPGADPSAEAEMMVATLEGAVMLSKLYDDPHYVNQAATLLAKRAASLART